MFDINKASVQEAMDYSVQMIVAQGGQSINARGSCTYRSDCGKKHCAIGHLLDKDDECAMGFGGFVGVLPEGCVPSLIQENLKVFQVLQEFHDSFMSSTRKRLVETLGILGIDVSGVWFNKWAEMGESNV